MQVQSINKTPSFGTFKITPQAKALIELEAGGAAKIEQYTKELASSKWDLSVKTSGKDNIYTQFGDNRAICVIPVHHKDNWVMVSSANSRYLCDNDADIVDCLKFSSSKRAKEVYGKLRKHFLAKNPNGGLKKTPLQHLDWAVYAMKAFEDAEIVSQEISPWACFLDKYPRTLADPFKKAVPFVENKKAVEKKPSLNQRLSNAWNAFLGK